MHTRTTSHALIAVGAAALLAITGCSSTGVPDAERIGHIEPDEMPDYETATVEEGVEVPDSIDLDSIYVEPGAPPLTEEDIWTLDPANELTAECTDPEALASNSEHDPAGWPQEWDGDGPMPDPECHPDFIETEAWDQLEDFVACWEGIETSTAMRTPDMTDDEANRILWEASRARADWSFPTDGEAFPGASDECQDLFEEHSASAEG